MTSADDAFVIGGYSRVCQLLKVAKEQLAAIACAVHRRRDSQRLVGSAAVARLDPPSREPRCKKRGRKLTPDSLPVIEQSSPAYDECLSEPCVIHRFLGGQGEVKATHLTKDCRVVKKLREGVSPPTVPTPAASKSAVSYFVGMVRSESIIPVSNFDSGECSSRGSSGSRPYPAHVGVFMAGTPPQKA